MKKWLEQLETTHKDEINVMHTELAGLRVMQGEAKEREDKLTKELDQARHIITSTTQELDLSKQNLKDNVIQRITAIEQEAKKKTDELCKSLEDKLKQESEAIQRKLVANLGTEIQTKIDKLVQNSELFKSALSAWEASIYTRALNLSGNKNVPVIIVMAEPMVSALTYKETIKNKGWFSELFYTNCKMCLNVQANIGVTGNNLYNPDLPPPHEGSI